MRKLQTKSIIEKESKPPGHYTDDFMAFIGWQLIAHTERYRTSPAILICTAYLLYFKLLDRQVQRGVLPTEGHDISCFEISPMICSFQPSRLHLLRGSAIEDISGAGMLRSTRWPGLVKLADSSRCFCAL